MAAELPIAQMNFPVTPEQVRVVPGSSGLGLQVTCACGCVNWNHIEISEAGWFCRNCGRVLSHDFPRLVERVKQDGRLAPPKADAS